MRIWLATLVVITACTDDAHAPDPSPSCSVPTTSATVNLHTTISTQLLDPQHGDATWVAVRDGEAGCPWTVATGDGHGAYALPVTHDDYAVAIACSAPLVTPSLQMIERTVTETTDVTASCAAQLTDVSGAHPLAIDFESGTTPVTYAPYLGTVAVPPLFLSGGPVGVTFMASAGHFDVAVVGNVDPDGAGQLLISRALDPTADPTVTADLSQPGWLALGPALTLGPNTPTPEGTVSGSLSYLTSYGTVVSLASSVALPAQVPTWPSSASDPGDAYDEVLDWRSGDFTRDWEAESFTFDPTTTTLPTPRVIDAGATIGTSDSAALRLAALPGATGYTVGCTFGDHVINYDVSAGVVGVAGQLAYDLDGLPVDPALPAAWTSIINCPRWDVVGYGSDGGLATEATIAQLGSLAGVPAQLAGKQRWRSSAHLQASF